MKPPIDWLPVMDGTIRRMRSAGKPWDAIAFALGVTRRAVINRADAIGAKHLAPVPKIKKGRELLGAEPLRAGHEWALEILKNAPGLEAFA